MAGDTPNKTVKEYIATYAFPALLSFVTMMVYNDMQEVKSDVKALLTQANQDRVKIEYLQKEVENLRRSTTLTTSPKDNNNDDQQNQNVQLFAILPAKNDVAAKRYPPNTEL